jgi:glycosyltransferase involved in cell wall biosynthesis
MAAMKHIICTVTNDLTYDQRMQRICSSLADNGYAVTLVGRVLGHSQPLRDFPFQQHRLQCFSNTGKLFYVEFNIRLFIYLLRQNYDIAYAVDLDTILPQFLAARLRRKPCIYDAHEYFTETPEVVRRPLVQKIWAFIAGRTIPQMAACLTVGNGLAQLLGERYRKEFSVVRNMPFRQSEVPAKIPTSPYIILYQGMLNEGRGLEAMIAAMKEISDAELWLVGEGDLSDELRGLVQEYEVTDKVQFLGFVPPDQLKAITLQADIGINLLENKGLSYYYSLANKALDYVQAGLPSLQMNFPEYRHLNEEIACFVLIDDLQTSSITLAIQKLQNDPLYYTQLQQNCHLAAQQWNWENEQRTLLNIVCSLY